MVENDCKNQRNLLYLIEDFQGQIFGGFHKKGRKFRNLGEESYTFDKDAFIFNVTQKKIFRPNNDDKALTESDSNSLTLIDFGDFDL